MIDVNNDNKPDIIVANQLRNNVGVLLNNGQGMFLSQTVYSIESESDPRYVSVVDINGDDKPDIVVAINGGNGFEVFLNFGNGTFLFQEYYQTGVQ